MMTILKWDEIFYGLCSGLGITISAGLSILPWFTGTDDDIHISLLMVICYFITLITEWIFVYYNITNYFEVCITIFYFLVLSIVPCLMFSNIYIICILIGLLYIVSAIFTNQLWVISSKPTIILIASNMMGISVGAFLMTLSIKWISGLWLQIMCLLLFSSEIYEKKKNHDDDNNDDSEQTRNDIRNNDNETSLMIIIWIGSILTAIFHPVLLCSSTWFYCFFFISCLVGNIIGEIIDTFILSRKYIYYNWLLLSIYIITTVPLYILKYVLYDDFEQSIFIFCLNLLNGFNTGLINTACFIKSKNTPCLSVFRTFGLLLGSIVAFIIDYVQ